MGDPTNVYDEADFISHSMSPEQVYEVMIKNRNDGTNLCYFAVDFHCDTEARSYCAYEDDGSNTNLVDYVLLTHIVRFIPRVLTAWRGWDRYRFFVRALDDSASQTLHQGDAIPAAQVGDWFNDESAPGVSVASRQLRKEYANFHGRVTNFIRPYRLLRS